MEGMPPGKGNNEGTISPTPEDSVRVSSDPPQFDGTLTARWVLPVSAPPLLGGTVTVAAGRIVAVDPAGVRRADLDLGDAVVIPGLVNVHTHLDLSAFRTPVPHTGSFPDWLRAVVAHRPTRSPEQVQQDIRAGIAESLRAGVTLVGDIAGGGRSWDALAASPLRAVVFHELLGLSAERAADALARARAWLRDHAPTPTCRPGLSPHAPYSVRAGLFRDAAELAAEYGCPVSIHLAESVEEGQLLRTREGPFVPFLRERGVWDPDGLVRDFAEVLRLNAGVPSLVLAHGNYLEPEAVPAERTAVVYCPRTHVHFGHAPHPFRALLARGVHPGLGTDSRASNPDLDLLAELRFLHRLCPDAPGETLLKMATLWGARALGWGEETGSIEPGKSADLTVIATAETEDRCDPYRSLFEGGPVTHVLCGGRRVVWAGALTAIPS
jgi:cytosine/adenosine deaminase-related metal-dependent hydrolase